MNFVPAGAESDEENEDSLPEFILEQIGHHGWNVNNVMNLFDDLDLMGFDVDDDDDMFDDFDDDDDYDDFLDSDFDYEDSDEERRKYVTGIFKTLEDSAQVLNKLTFHRESSKALGSRLPRVLPGQTETYECLHRLFEEIELLLKVWKKRVNHPFTAHLERKSPENENSEEPDSGFGSGLRIGHDYNESDVESDTTDHRYSYRSKTNVNLTLTRKKYCQSTKVYYNIFNSEFEFKTLLSQIKSMRKHVFNIAFNLFLQNVPAEKLPNELWEKIWKLSLSHPEHDMPPTHSSGVREKDSRKWTLFENDRITDCFGAAGNIHMILFEILYKHHYIMLPPHLVELDTGGNLTQMKYMRFYFFKFVKLLTRKFARLEILDNGQFKQESCMATNDLSVKKKMDKGLFHLSDVDLSDDSHKKDLKSLFIMIFAKEPCPYMAYVYENETKLQIAIWNVIRNEEVCSIKTNLDHIPFHLDKGVSGTGTTKFSMTKSQFSLLIDEPVTVAGAILHVWKWNENTTEPKILMIDPNFHSQLETTSKIVKSLITVQDNHLVDFRYVDHWNEIECTTLLVGETENGELRVLRKIKFPTVANTSLGPKFRDFKDNKILLHFFKRDTVDPESNQMWLFDYQENEIIETYKMKDLCELTECTTCCKSEDSEEETSVMQCTYDCRFDLFRDQFILVKDYLSGYLIYDCSGKKPKLLTKGSLSFCNLTFNNFGHGSKLLFSNGLLFGTYRLEREMMPTTPNYLMYNNEDNDLLEIVSVDLETKSCQSITTFGPSTEVNSKFLLNETHRSIFLPKQQHCNHPGPQIFAITDQILTVVIDRSNFAKLDLSLHINEIAEREAEPMYLKQVEKEEALRAKEAVKAQKIKIANKYLEDSSLTIEGSIQLWKGSYGFMRAQGEAKALGNIFVHKSKITPSNSWIKVGQKIEAKLAKDEKYSNYMAVEVKLLSSPESFSNGGQRGFARGYYQRGQRRGGRSSRRGRGRGWR